MSINSDTSKEKNIAMVILAAGEGSRMKAIKQLLPWKESTLLVNAIEIGLKSNAISVLVVLGANSEDIRPSIGHLNIDIIENKNWRNGLGSSISCAVQHLKQNDIQVHGVLLCLADMPFVEVSHLNRLIECYHPNSHSILATGFKNGAIVPALFDAVYFSQLINLSGDKGAKQLLNIYSEILTVIKVRSEHNLIDLDTQNEYDIFKRIDEI